MERNKDLENFLGEMMSAEASTIHAPSSALMYEARAKVLARKKEVKERIGFFEAIVAFFKLDFKFYHVGLSLLLLSGGIFYLNEPAYHTGDASAFNDYKESLSITNTTISVNSSTMLTSIPTMVIRN